jgi:hypothetical protein
MAKAINYYVILNDRETYSALEGCTIVGISPKNRAANEALEEEDMETVLDRADSVSEIHAPSRA